LIHYRETVQMWHVEIQQDKIGLEFGIEGQRLARIRRAF